MHICRRKIKWSLTHWETVYCEGTSGRQKAFDRDWNRTGCEVLEFGRKNEMRMIVVWGNQQLDWRKNDNWRMSGCVYVCGDVSKPTRSMQTNGSWIQQKCELEWVGIYVCKCAPVQLLGHRSRGSTPNAAERASKGWRMQSRGQGP